MTHDVRAEPRRPHAIPRTRSWGIALALLTALISGVSIFVNGYAVKQFSGSAPFTTAKNLVAAGLLVVLLALAGRSGSAEGWTPPRSRGQRLGLVAVGVIGGAIAFLLFFEGLSRSSSREAAFIHKTLVVWVAVLAVALLRERLGWPHLLAIGALVAGQAMIAGDLGRLGLGSGELLILAATLLWAVEVVVAKRLLADLSALTVGVARMTIGVAVLVSWLVATGQIGVLLSYDASQWGWIALTGLLLTGYVASWYLALSRAPAVDVTAVLVFGAVVTALLSAAVQGTALRPDLLGLTIVAAGVLVITRAPAPTRAAVP